MAQRLKQNLNSGSILGFHDTKIQELVGKVPAFSFPGQRLDNSVELWNNDVENLIKVCSTGKIKSLIA